jgi:diguanylate cyclase (GGDEF)-like protein
LIRYLAGPEGHSNYREELYQLKVFDPWTGLRGRRYLLEFLQRELFATRRSLRPLSLALFELDDLSGIVERQGPLAGELAHRQVADRVRGSVRKTDLLAAAGPLQIAVCMYKSRPDDALRLAERLRRCVAETPFHHGDARFHASLSAGIAMTRGEPPVTPEELLDQAATRLRQAQADGGDRIVY